MPQDSFYSCNTEVVNLKIMMYINISKIVYWSACFLYDSMIKILKIDADEILLQNDLKKT